MLYFVVKITIQAGEYEKISTKLIRAYNQKEAEKNALLGECHGVIGESSEWTDKGISDLGMEFHYSIYSCKAVKAEHVDILFEYFK